MNTSHKHRSGQSGKAEPVGEEMAEIADKAEEVVATDGLDNIASLGSVGLLVDIIQLGEDLISRVPRQDPVSNGSAPVAVDPRNRNDPRKRFRPR